MEFHIFFVLVQFVHPKSESVWVRPTCLMPALPLHHNTKLSGHHRCKPLYYKLNFLSFYTIISVLFCFMFLSRSSLCPTLWIILWFCISSFSRPISCPLLPGPLPSFQFLKRIHWSLLTEELVFTMNSDFVHSKECICFPKSDSCSQHSVLLYPQEKLPEFMMCPFWVRLHFLAGGSCLCISITLVSKLVLVFWSAISVVWFYFLLSDFNDLYKFVLLVPTTIHWAIFPRLNIISFCVTKTSPTLILPWGRPSIASMKSWVVLCFIQGHWRNS